MTLPNQDQETQNIVDPSDLRKWRTELPNLYDDSDLDPFEFRLLAHYKRVGTCIESLGTTARKCKMSTGKVSETRQALSDKGFVVLTKRETPNEAGHIGYSITVVDKWEENFAHYSSRRPSRHEAQPSPREGTPSPHEGQPSQGEDKKEPLKKKPTKNTGEAKPRKANPMFDALAGVTNSDPSAAGGYIGKTAADLKAYPAELVLTAYGQQGWWYAVRCAGMEKVPTPTLAGIAKTIKEASDWYKANGRTFAQPQAASTVPVVKQKVDFTKGGIYA